ncbi:MAG: SGNH/GDSL hydrolase family protein, partial [Planctomycetes bacterium]|nr:SGNH/GDSL hydrolase family protein [Planctomycetota bacterium]
MTAAGARPLAIVLTGFALVCSPPVASRLIALEPFHPDDTLGGWCLTAALLATAWLVVARTRRAWVVRCALVATTLIATEVGARLLVRWFTDWPRQRLAALGRVAYPDLILFEAHPFLQFTGRPGTTLRGNRALASDTPFNDRGFFGPDFPKSKPNGTCRIVCLGASTTASGYPGVMQDWLNEHDATGTRFECVNLAHGFYNSNHSVVNFVLNALDLDPDYVVVHHGWNDARAAANAAEYRGDYVHVLKAFSPPMPADWLPIRASIVYRFARFRALGPASGDYLDAAVTRPFRPELGYDLE